MLTFWRVTPVPWTAHPGARRVVLIRWAARDTVRGSEHVTARSRHAKNSTPLKNKREWRGSGALLCFLCRACFDEVGVAVKQQPDQKDARNQRKDSKHP